MSELLNWLVAELSALVQYQVSTDMAKCILMIESPRDLENYLSGMIDLSNPTHNKFFKDLCQKKLMSGITHGYKKTQYDDFVQSKTQDKKKKGSKGKPEIKKEEEPLMETPDKKKKPKFVNIYSPEARDVVLLKGRHPCNCQASKHSLVNNCLKCGRVVCEQEGPGACFFCGSIVKARGDTSHTSHTSATLESALELKQRLLEYDKSSERRTKVYDDQSDYFTTNSVWLTKEQKDVLQKKEEELQALKHSRSNRTFCLDFTGRCIVQEDYPSVVEESLIDEVNELLSSSTISERHDTDPSATITLNPVYEGNDNSECGSRWHNNIGRVQDSQVMEMTDAGLCLSLHQPWATLLIMGIKKHEGRSWYTPHRGRLWIASAAKIPSEEEIETVVDFYKRLRGENVKFPKKFPTGVLLGCVTLSDCIAQEDYIEKFPDGESESPFVFICDDPIMCPVMFPIQGKHKIYKLEPKIHQAASKCIQKMAKR